MHIQHTEIILYVSDQEKSRGFYELIFRRQPDLHVPGMTEFILSAQCKIGLMPNQNIARILAGKTPHPETGNGIPRCELYFIVDDIQYEYENAIKAGAKPISPIEDRNWGDRACYFADPDGHILVFAQKIQ